ncbi:hypothetical protein CPC08DRAFT_705081 [Agrocybe pediades]|nr:hypothetical protein CPC08DRAFT_705081 [Agrocybe pediades]
MLGRYQRRALLLTVAILIRISEVYGNVTVSRSLSMRSTRSRPPSGSNGDDDDDDDPDPRTATKGERIGGIVGGAGMSFLAPHKWHVLTSLMTVAGLLGIAVIVLILLRYRGNRAQRKAEDEEAMRNLETGKGQASELMQMLNRPK